MKVVFTQAMIAAIGPKVLARTVGDERDLQYREQYHVQLPDMPKDKVAAILALLEKHKGVKGAATAIRDIGVWREVSAGKSVKSRTVEQFSTQVHILLQKTAGHRVYRRDAVRDLWLPYYVGKIEYIPKHRGYNSGEVPEHCIVTLYWREFGLLCKTQETFWRADCCGMVAGEALLRRGIVPETADMRAEHVWHVERWDSTHADIGRQYLATGTATLDVDTADKRDGRDSWRGPSKVVLGRDGGPSHVVVDVFFETDERPRDKVHEPGWYFWESKVLRAPDDDTQDEPEPDASDAEPLEIPFHPMVAVFDLQKQLRCKVHVAQLELYEYQTDLGSKLVLPDDTRRLVDLLLSTKSGFRDIVRGKGAGSVVLCAGPPGVGKTLTSEVYSEVMQRPLYTVQCSQLGIDPAALEGALLLTFTRAQRWNAILLLDEADVYVAARGASLEQNAIVGVFLRVLEYYSGVMFLTTNRAEMVDDAIASRCLAKLEYVTPTPAEQARIWHILTENSGVATDAATVDAIVVDNPGLSGRDVKNLLKLVMLSGMDLSVDAVRFVRKFKPTGARV